MLYCYETEDDAEAKLGSQSSAPICEACKVEGWGGSRGWDNLQGTVMEWWCAVEKVYVGASGGTTQRAIEQRRGLCPVELRATTVGGRERQAAEDGLACGFARVRLGEEEVVSVGGINIVP